MIGQVGALWRAFHLGEQLVAAATWKNRAIAVNALAAFLIAAIGVAREFGYDLPLSESDATQIAGGVLALVALFNAVVHTVTSKKVGLPPVGGTGAGSAGGGPGADAQG